MRPPAQALLASFEAAADAASRAEAALRKRIESSIRGRCPPAGTWR
jgi:hypothetical protein